MTQRYNFKEKLQPAAVFEAIKKIAAKENSPAYVVGGFVRDLILRRPCKDIDFVCVGNGIELAALVGEALCFGQTILLKILARLACEMKIMKWSWGAHASNPSGKIRATPPWKTERWKTINSGAISP